MELKKPHPSKLVAEADMKRAGPIPMCGELKLRRDTSGMRDLGPTADPTAQVSSARKISLKHLWL